MKTGNDLLGTISVVFISMFIFSACLFMTYKRDHMDLYDDTFPYYIPSVDVRVSLNTVEFRHTDDFVYNI